MRLLDGRVVMVIPSQIRAGFQMFALGIAS